MEKNLVDYNEMIDRNYLELFERRYKSKLPQSNFQEFPIKLLNIANIFESVTEKYKPQKTAALHLSEKLVDIKTLYFFLDNCHSFFYLGTTLIVGNGELEKVNINTLSLLQGNHYKVYLISSLYEKLLDFFELLYFNKMSDPKKNKWGMIFNKLSTQVGFDFIESSDNDDMLLFREKVRRGEMHGYSTVFRQLYKNQWNGFGKEENILKKISQKLYINFK